jgi:hypothetical protein
MGVANVLLVLFMSSRCQPLGRTVHEGRLPVLSVVVVRVVQVALHKLAAQCCSIVAGMQAQASHSRPGAWGHPGARAAFDALYSVL